MYLFILRNILTSLILASLCLKSIEASENNSLIEYPRLGDSIITNYSSGSFDSTNTNWFVQQHANGVIYVSTADGFFSFDGENWRKHHLIDNIKPEIRQFKIHNDNKIYVGAQSEFGYFEAATNGDLKYHSLLPLLKPKQQKISDVNNVYILNDKIFFITPEQIMAYTPNKGIKVWSPDTRFSRAWQAGNKLFLNDGSSLKYIEKESIFTIESFEDKNITSYGFVQKINKGYLIGTFSQGIYLWKDGVLTNWLTKDKPEAKMGLYNSLLITPSIFAVSTIRNGVLFFNHQAEVLYHLNTDNGLPTNITLNLFLDSQQGLWLAQEGQLTRAQLPFELSTFTAQRHTISKIRNFVHLNDELFISAVNGVMGIDKNSKVKRLDGALTSTANILKYKQSLLIAGAKQCQLIDPVLGISQALMKSAMCRDIHLSRKHPNSLFYISEHSIGVVQNIEGKWNKANDIMQTDRVGSALVEDKHGQIWSSNLEGDLLKFWFNKGWHGESIKVDSNEVVPLMRNGNLHIASDKGFYLWDHKNNTLGNKVDWFHQYFGDNADAPYLLHQDQQRLWLASSEHTGYFSLVNGQPKEWNNYPVTASNLSSLRRVYEHQGITWLGFNNGIARYQPLANSEPSNIKAHITQLSLKTAKQSLFLNILSSPSKTIETPLQNDSLRASFGLTSYLQGDKNKFRYQLNDQAWSQWSDENYVDLGELSGGDYQLAMQAQDHQTITYTAKSLLFTIIPPWYKTIWAYALYIIITFFIFFIISSIIVKIRTRSLLQRQQLLEQQVIDRTATIQKQADQLEKLDKVKSRFFANVSHEFRTPLTLAIGPLQELIKNNRITDQQDQQHIKVALGNSQQMLSLVGQILDINRLESGEMQLAITQIPLAQHLQKILSRFQLLADKRKIKLNTIGFSTNELLWFDEDHLNKIINNLLSNALKFSPEKSTITLSLKFDHNNDRVIISIQDQGKGIPNDEKNHLFERFYQGKNSNNHLQPGTGIGLSMVKELLDLHQGKIKLIESEKGCHFEIILKLSENHYQAQDFIDKISSRKLKEANINEINQYEKSYNIESSSNHSANCPTILIVDDNQDLRTFIRSTLQTVYSVIEASNGEEALKLVKEKQPDFIISDIMMPIMDGLQLTKNLKSDPKTAHIPLLLLTAKSTKRDTVEGLQYGADDYLSKPFDSSELIARIAAHLQQKRNIAKAIYQKFMTETKDNRPTETVITPLKELFKDKFESLITERLPEAEFNIENMADFFNMERTTLFRRVKKYFNCTPNQYLKSQRLHLSLQMLNQQSGTISEVAYAVGFQSLNYFSRSFRKQYNVPPSEYQNI